MEITFISDTSAGIDSNLFRNVQLKLRSVINNKDYGNGVNDIVIGLICVSPEYERFSKPRSPKYYDNEVINIDGKKLRTRKEFSVSIKLDFDTIKNSGAEQISDVLCSKLLSELVPAIRKHKKIKDFDVDAFESDLRLFAGMVNTMPAPEAKMLTSEDHAEWESKFLPNEPDKTLSQLKKKKWFKDKEWKKVVDHASGEHVYPSIENRMKETVAQLMEQVNDAERSKEILKAGLSKFDPFLFDTVQREYITTCFEEIAKAAGVNFSFELNAWLYDDTIAEMIQQGDV